MIDRETTLFNPTIDAALRHLATFWSHRRHVVSTFNAQFQNVHYEQQPPDGAEPVYRQLGSSHPAINASPIHAEPLYIIISLGIALLIVDFAFGHLIYGGGSSKGGTMKNKGEAFIERAPAPSVASSGYATPSTPEDAKDAADEWEYFKRTKCRVLLLSMVLGFASEFLLWMLAPFFPLEALSRGVSTEVVGLVFACHPIALSISSQIAPWLMRNVEPFVILQRTLLIQAVFIASFGLAGTIQSGVPFAACACVNRLLLGLMSGINEPCSQAVTLRLVPSHAVAYAFGLIIASRFSAMVIGPVMGGVLYDAGGFPLPFLVSGLIFLCLGVLTMYVGATTPVASLPPAASISVWRLLRLRGVLMMLLCIFLLWFNVMFLEPCFEPVLASPPYSLDSTHLGLILSAATFGMVSTMSLSGRLNGILDPYTQHTIGFLIVVTALPFLGPTPHFHLQPHIALFIGALVLTYIGVGLVGPTQSVLCLRILSQAGLSQQEVASALAAANVTFSTLGSLCGPLVAGALVPKVFAFDQMTSVQSAFTALCYLPALYLLGRDRPGPRPKPCGGCITCCSFLNSCCCPCFTCCQKEGCQWPSACCGERGEEELLEMEGGQTGTKKVT